MKRNNILKKSGITLFALIVLNIICVSVYWNTSVSFSENKFTKPYDCGILFFHSVTKQGTLSSDTKERSGLCAKLYKEGIIRKVICAGGASSDKSGSKMMREYTIKLGVPDSCIFSDTLSYSSETNIIEANKIIKSENFSSVLLISSPTHILRLKYIAGKYLERNEIGLCTFKYDYPLTDIFFDCNTEFAKWVYLLFLPESFKSFSKKLLDSIF